MLENSFKTSSLSEAGNSPTGVGAASAGDIRVSGGKVTHDSRGNAVYDWGVATGVFARIESAELLSMLENPTLALEGDCGLGAGDWAGDPYNRR
jgi:hypothetical protein